MSHNYYDLLNIPRTATPLEVEEAYKMAQETYSSSNEKTLQVFTKEESVEILKMMDEAFAVIGNSALRNLYDRKSESGRVLPEQVTLDALMIAHQLELAEKNKFEKPIHVIDEDFEHTISNCTEWNGEMIKKVREYKKMTYEYLTHKTKINPWYIQAIEEMNAKDLPAQVFVRGYIVQVARHLCLNEKLVADSYMKLYTSK